MLSRPLTRGLFAGAAAGLITGLLQLVFVQPILLHAELYESGALVHLGAVACFWQKLDYVGRCSDPAFCTAPDTFSDPVPAEIAALFAARALGLGLAGWVILECRAAYFLDK